MEGRVWEKLFPRPSLSENSFTLFLQSLGMDARDMRAILDVKHTHEGPTFTNDTAKNLKERLRKMRGVLREELKKAEPEQPGRGVNQYSGSDIIRPSSYGTDPTYILRRLKRDHPELAEKVVSGEMSANAAAIEAGFRKKTITVPADLDGATDALIKRFGADALYEMVRQKVGRGSGGSRA